MSDTWKLTRLGEIVEPVVRSVGVDPLKEYPLLGVRLDGLGAFHRETVLGSEISATTLYQVKFDDFIYSRLFAWRGAFGIIPVEFDGYYVSNEFPIYRVVQDMIDIKFLLYRFRITSVLRAVENDSSGSTPLTRNRYKERYFEALQIPLPPLDEQRRIVAHIDALAARIAEARGLRLGAVEEAEAFTRSQARALLSEIQELPTELRAWVDPSREGIQTGPFGAQLSSEDFLEEGHPLITIGNVQFDGLKLDSLRYVSEAKAIQLKRYAAQTGDILFARMGTVGRCCVVPEFANGWLFNYHIIRVAPDHSRIESRFLHWTIQTSSDIEQYLESSIRGATREGVNTKIVGGLPCRVPPLDEQSHIVAYLDDLQARVDALKRLQQETAAELDALLPSVLDRAFKGEL